MVVMNRLTLSVPLMAATTASSKRAGSPITSSVIEVFERSASAIAAAPSLLAGSTSSTSCCSERFTLSAAATPRAPLRPTVAPCRSTLTNLPLTFHDSASAAHPSSPMPLEPR